MNTSKPDAIFGGVVTPLRRLPSPFTKKGRGTPLNPGTLILKAGSVHGGRGAQPLVADIHLDRDVAIELRDGVTLRGDVYRPAGVTSPLPTVLAFTPYGKSGGYWRLDLFPFRAGIPKKGLSGLQTFESPDPNHWCHHGYAIVVVDTRGSYLSEGHLQWWGENAANDGHDVVEWIAAQPWSNKRVGMCGNSQLAMIQWTIAAVRPPHLVAIAPWEGLANHYTDNICDGGIPFPAFSEDVMQKAFGQGYAEDITAMIDERPLFDEYWADKAPRVEDIDVPAYVVASTTNALHAKGTLSAFRRLGSDLKWLRVHNTMEWPDFYEPRNINDLRMFFDRFLKDEKNGWEHTPRVRLSVIDIGGDDVVDRAEESWPPERTQDTVLYLDATEKKLSTSPPGTESTATYVADDGLGRVYFDYVFDTDTELIGYPLLVLAIHTDDADDMDIFARIEKIDKSGRPKFRVLMPPPFKALEKLMTIMYRLGRLKYGFIFYGGPGGRLRASHRASAVSPSAPLEPALPPISVSLVEPGDIVSLDIEMWPMSLLWRAGETLRLSISGTDPRGYWFPEVPPPATINRGNHVLHTGGKFDARLTLPVAPRP